MDPQLVDWGGSAVLLGIFWQATAWSMKRVIRRLDRQDEDLAELRADMKAGQAGLDAKVVGLAEGQAELKADMKAGRAELKEGQVRIDGNILRIVGDLGEVRGELKRIAPREKAAASGS